MVVYHSTLESSLHLTLSELERILILCRCDFHQLVSTLFEEAGIEATQVEVLFVTLVMVANAINWHNIGNPKEWWHKRVFNFSGVYNIRLDTICEFTMCTQLCLLVYVSWALLHRAEYSCLVPIMIETEN